MTEHPKRWIAIRYRSKRRTLNLAFAYRGRSSGWGDAHGNDKPSRWFIGHYRGWSYHRGVELAHGGPGLGDYRTLLAYEWGSGPANSSLAAPEEA